MMGQSSSTQIPNDKVLKIIKIRIEKPVITYLRAFGLQTFLFREQFGGVFE